MAQGLIDTVKFRAEAPLDQRDIRSLVASGFSHRRNVRVSCPGEELQAVDVRDFLHNEITGMRVMGDAMSTCVEASVPRVCGRSNDLQADISEDEASAAFDRMTIGALPWTSEVSGWGATRLDLARNFRGSVPLVVGAYSRSAHREIRCTPKVFFGESVSWFGSKRQIVIYDKGLEMGRSPGVFGRVESRWLGRRGISAFLAPSGPSAAKTEGWSWSRPSGPSLPVWVRFGDGWRVTYTPLSWDAYDSRFRADIEGFGRKCSVPVFRSLAEVAYSALLRDADLHVSFWDGLSERTARRYRRNLAAYRQGVEDVDLVRLVWESPAA